jgi:two-component system sensor histidine kinase KdpD
MRAILGSVVAVTGATLLVWALEPVAPTLSLGVLYMFAVLPVAVLWGIRWSLPVAIASMLAFNFFFLPPTHNLSLADSSNWAALTAYSVTALVVSELAARARRRAADAEEREREASLLAEIARHLLGGTKLEPGWVERRAAEVLGGPRAEIDEGVRALLAVAQDRRRLEQEALDAEALRRSDVVKTALLRAVSHDLRSPLTSITTAIGALRNTELVFTARDRSELLETIAVDADRLARLVEDLLDLSRLESGGAAPEPEVWAFDELARDVVADLPEAGRVDVAGASPLVDVDPVHIRRVLANFLENALKFSAGDSAVHVRVSATRSEAILRVVDQGPGIDSAALERVFDPFYRVDSRSGAGLGLAIARGFATANGGRVWAESRPGQGATFALALPVVHSPVEITA